MYVQHQKQNSTFVTNTRALMHTLVFQGIYHTSNLIGQLHTLYIRPVLYQVKIFCRIMLISHSLHAQETELYIACTSHIEFDHLQPQYKILHALKFSLIQVFFAISGYDKSIQRCIYKLDIYIYCQFSFHCRQSMKHKILNGSYQRLALS